MKPKYPKYSRKELMAYMDAKLQTDNIEDMIDEAIKSACVSHLKEWYQSRIGQYWLMHGSANYG